MDSLLDESSGKGHTDRQLLKKPCDAMDKMEKEMVDAGV